MDTIKDRKKMGDMLAGQKPLWPPGTAHGYHALTQGFFVDQLLLRVDPMKRSVGQFFQEEVAAKFGREKAICVFMTCFDIYLSVSIFIIIFSVLRAVHEVTFAAQFHAPVSSRFFMNMF